MKPGATILQSYPTTRLAHLLWGASGRVRDGQWVRQGSTC